MRTQFVRKEDVENGTYPRNWWIVDAEGKTLGRLATEVARRLRGKHKAIFAPHTDVGDFVVIVNAEKVTVTGNKEMKKIYYRHTGYPGGIKETRLDEMRERKPEALVEKAVKGMMAKNALNRNMLRRLKVYVGPEHPHSAQQPQLLEV
jgi:large subunit ribosomal protein L13